MGSKHWTKHFCNVIIMGMPGIGKSTFAKTYAHHSGRAYFDLDHDIERMAGLTIPQIFEQKGERVFRQMELDCLERVCRNQNFYVFALGGGTVQNLEILAFLREQGLLVTLDAPLDWLAKQLWKHKGVDGRPLLAHTATCVELQQQLETLYADRAPFYTKADVILSVENSSHDALKLQLALVEQRASSKSYMDDVGVILQNSASFTIEQW